MNRLPKNHRSGGKNCEICGLSAGSLAAEGCRYLFVHLSARRRFVRRCAAPAAAPAADLTVSLTTVPSRLPYLFPTLNALLDQTVLPKRFLLALPRWSRREQRPYRVPELLRSQHAVTLIEEERDWGPATKLIPALRRPDVRPDEAVLGVDDDNIYPRRFLETFARHATAIPEAALSLRGWPVPASLRWRDSRAIKGTEITTPLRTDVITGCAGILVRPRFLDAAFAEYESAPSEAFFVDDIWISGHLARRRVPRFVLPFPGPWIYAPAIASCRGRGLNAHENRNGMNNDRMLEYFAAWWSQPAGCVASEASG
jgi:hypothetical protein